MNTFNKKSLCVALAATGLLGAGGVAQAVNLSADGTGDVLVFPYYTVRTTAAGNAYNTYINITNTTASTKAVKVRFREGKNSREVLDFNVFLSPVDMWTAAVVPTADGAAVLTYDTSCTIPSFTSGVAVPFRNIKYANTSAGNNDDGGGSSLDRTREGYVEVFEMATYAAASVIGVNSLHSQATGLPVDCTKVTDALGASEKQAIRGGVTGSLQLINPGAGASMSVNPVVFDNFYSPIVAAAGDYYDTGSPNPAMTMAGPTSAVMNGTNLVVSTGWTNADAASAVLMHDSILNEFILDAGTLSKTDWVVTFPTKWHYVDRTAPVLAPFQRIWDTTTGKSCDDVTFAVRDREERIRAAAAAGGPDFSPRQAGPLVDTPTLCYEANVVTFNGSNLLGSKNSSLNIGTTVGTTPVLAANGWAKIFFDRFTAATYGKLTNAATTTVSLASGGVVSGPTTATYAGLPVVGFNVFTYTNSALVVGGVTANVPTNYGMGVAHKSTTSIVSP